MYSPETPQILVGVFRIESVSVRGAETHESIEFHGRQKAFLIKQAEDGRRIRDISGLKRASVTAFQELSLGKVGITPAMSPCPAQPAEIARLGIAKPAK